jgi:Fic family protein
MKRQDQGQYETISSVEEKVLAFIPHPLPPRPPLRITPDLREKMDNALLALGRLDSLSTILPDTDLFLYMYVRKEALLSSQIEGTQSSLSDLLLFEMEAAPGVPIDDVQEVSCYVAAMNHGLKRLRQDGFPLSLRLVKEIHHILLSSGRGSSKDPGEFRTSQNWIGGARPGKAAFVPPPAHRLPECLGAWEGFLHDKPEKTPALIKAALAHAQFETIHPFLDGNGRLGRLLITLVLCQEKVLREPLLYLSLYFKSHRHQYYDLLQRLRTEGEWEEWLDFFITATGTTAAQAWETAGRLKKMIEHDRDKIKGMGRQAGTLLRVHHAFLEKPILSIKAACKITRLVPNAVNKALNKLIQAGMAHEVTGRRRNRLFAYKEYVKIISEGTEPLA